MGREQMNQQVAAELPHIPQGPYESQGMLRHLYSAERRASLGRRATPGQTAGGVLRHCIRFIRAGNPGAAVLFDGPFFGIGADDI